MKTSVKLIMAAALSLTVAACGNSSPSEADVMSKFNGWMNMRISQSETMEDFYRANPEVLGYDNAPKVTPSATLIAIRDSGKFKGCVDGQYDGQKVCTVEVTHAQGSNTFDYSFIKKGEGWEFAGGL